MSERPLSELDPCFGPIDGARGLVFDCPVCEGVKAHSIAVTFDPPSLFPSGAVWKLVDGNPDTFTVSPSIDCSGSGTCSFHGFVDKGVVRW
jgi:hypothetical protein